MPEGFAHFVAAVAFNDIAQADGVFRYYKDIDTSADGVPAYTDFVGAGNRVSLQGGVGTSVLGGHNAWVAGEQDCDQDWNNGTNEVTSEIDWMRFFWQFLTDTGGAEPEFWDVVHLLAFTDAYTQAGVAVYAWTQQGPVWPNLLNAIADSASGLTAYATWFEDIMPEHGVYNEGP